jgi:serine/threonine-protein kinase
MGAPQIADSLVGRVVAGRYEVLGMIGRGGMGSVYEVRHLTLRRTFALKKLSEGLAGDPTMLARFRREAEVIASLRHPNVVEIIDWETLEDGTPCIVMERLHGQDLAQRLAERGPLPWPAIARIADAVLAALEVAHRADIVHRDLKPQNIFLARDDAGEEHVKLLDFGLSKVGDRNSISSESLLVGTPLYMAPEQANGQRSDVGPATDVWAMGSILYEMATGRAAFDAPSSPVVLYRICYGQPEPLAQHRPDAPASLVSLIGAALSRDASLRVREVAELRRRLRAALPGLDGERAAEAVTLPQGLTPPPRPKRRFAAALLIALVLLAAAGVVLLRGRHDPRPLPPPAPTLPPPMPPPAAAAPPAPPPTVGVAPAASPPPPTSPAARPKPSRKQPRATPPAPAAEPQRLPTLDP